jgi:dipeptidyl aminopeptidase/acylaminoacyl peptidase
MLSHGQRAALYALEDILSAPFPSQLTAAAASDRLAWVTEERGRRNVWVAEGPVYEARPLTAYEEDDGQEISELTFSADGAQVLYVRGGAPNRRGEIPNPAGLREAPRREIWTAPFEGGVPRRLAEGSGLAVSVRGEVAFIRQGQIWLCGLEAQDSPRLLLAARGNLGSLRWRPDGRRLAFVSNRGDHSFVGYCDLDGKYFHFIAPSLDRDSEPAWSPDGRRLAWMRQPHQGARLPFIPQLEAQPWSIWVGDPERGTAEKIWEAALGTGSVFRMIAADNQLLWRDGDQIVFPYEGQGWTHLWAAPATGGAARCLTPGEFEVQYVSPGPDGRSILYSSNQNDIDRQHIWLARVDAGAPAARLLTPGQGLEWLPVAAVPSGRIAFLGSGAARPAQPFLLEADGKRRALSELPARFPASRLVTPEAVLVSAVDGKTFHAQLFRPTNLAAGERRPAIIFIHGGSRRQMLLGFHDRGYYHNAYAFNQYLAARGYIVLSINFRSGTGYGLKFREAENYGAGGASEFNDVLGAGLYLRARADVDPARIGLWGGSYGGFLTALGLARASDLFAAGVDIHGVHDWNTGIQNFMPNYNPLEQPETARLAFQSSPLHHVDGWRSPVLLIHGDDDRNVQFSESVRLLEALRERGVKVEQLVFPDEVHSFLLHRNWLAAYQAADAFFARTLGDGKR